MEEGVWKMKAFHIACGSSNLSLLEVRKGKRSIFLDKCNHCDRIIEAHEINSTRMLLYKAVSNVELGSRSDDTAKMIIESCKK
jgi:hypothetical protein